MYYGLPIYATRMVFIMDTSRSMLGFRLMAAKRELSAAIDALRPNDQFTVLVFDSNVRMWQKKLVVADATNKKKAIQFVNKQDTNLQTASFDALEAALGFDAEAIFFLTDGAPFGGKVAAPPEIVRIITLVESLAARVDLHDRHWGRIRGEPDGHVSADAGRVEFRPLPPRRRMTNSGANARYA